MHAPERNEAIQLCLFKSQFQMEAKKFIANLKGRRKGGLEQAKENP